MQLVELTTEDMALVAFLKLEGVEYARQRRLGTGGCCWVYCISDRTQRLFDDYHAGEAAVDPREFARKLGLVRTDMYRFLGIKPKRVRN